MGHKRRAIESALARVDRLRDEDIDYSDIPELDDEVFAQPLVPWPPKKETVTIQVDSDVLGWFKRQGRRYQTRINQVLRRYMSVAGERRPSKTRERQTTAGRGRTSRRR